MLPLEGAALAYNNTFLPWTVWSTIILVLLMTVFRILFHPNAIEIFYALHRLLVNFFADLIIYNAESIQLVYNSGQKLLVCSVWYWVMSIASGMLSVEGSRQVRRRAINIALGQYWFSPSCMASFHQDRGNTEFYCPGLRRWPSI